MITVFVFTVLIYARADYGDIRATLARPGRLAITVVAAILAPPILLGMLVAIVGREAIEPALLLGLALYVASPVLNGSPAYALLLGFRNGLILTVLFINLLATPLVAPAIASLLVGETLPLSGGDLAIRLAIVIFGATIGAFLLRRVVGKPWLDRNAEALNGLNVVMYFLFAIAAMDGVIDATRADPLRTVWFLAVAFAVSAAAFSVALVLARRPLGENDGFTLSMGIGLRNIGLLVAAFGPSLPAESYLYFSLSQFPTYLAPLLLGLAVRRWPRLAKGGSHA